MKTKLKIKSRSYNEILQDHNWLATNGLEIQQKHRGKWIAVNNEQIIAHDRDFDKVAAVAHKLQVDALYTQIPEEDTIIYGYRAND
jgi:hypothetical protein